MSEAPSQDSDSQPDSIQGFDPARGFEFAPELLGINSSPADASLKPGGLEDGGDEGLEQDSQPDSTQGFDPARGFEFAPQLLGINSSTADASLRSGGLEDCGDEESEQGGGIPSSHESRVVDGPGVVMAGGDHRAVDLGVGSVLRRRGVDGAPDQPHPDQKVSGFLGVTRHGLVGMIRKGDRLIVLATGASSRPEDSTDDGDDEGKKSTSGDGLVELIEKEDGTSRSLSVGASTRALNIDIPDSENYRAVLTDKDQANPAAPEEGSGEGSPNEI